MANYELRTRNATVFDGQKVDADTVVGVLVTEQPLANVLSAAAFGGLLTVEVDADTVSKIVPRVAIDLPQPADVKTPAPDVDPNADPDALNAADAADDARAAAEAEAAAKAAAEKAAAEEIEIPETLAGLDVRIAKALARQGITSREDVTAYLAEPDADLVDLDDIGKAAVAKILDWMKG
jgi:hypothetical protein